MSRCVEGKPHLDSNVGHVGADCRIPLAGREAMHLVDVDEGGGDHRITEGTRQRGCGSEIQAL